MQDEQESALPRLLLLGSSSGVGVSSIAKGLVVSLKELNCNSTVSTLDLSLSETTHYRRISSRLSHTISPELLDESGLVDSYYRSLQASDLHILEGSGTRSLEFALGFIKKVDVPLVLVIDASKDLEDGGVRVASLLRELKVYDHVGVIANYANKDYEKQRVNALVDSIEGATLLGMIPRFERGQFAGRSSVTLNRNPSLLTRNQLVRLKGLVEQELDNKAVLDIAKQARAIPIFPSPEFNDPLCSIAVADDSAFHLSIQDNWDLLRRNGAKLISFSPLIDSSVPKGAQGLYLPGSYLDLYLEEIVNNKAMLSSLKKVIQSGMPTVVEGDSIALLCSVLDLGSGTPVESLNLVPVEGIYKERIPMVNPQVDVLELKSLHSSPLGRTGLVCSGISNCSWDLNKKGEVPFGFGVTSLINDIKDTELNAIARKAAGGFSAGPNVIATGACLHWGSNPKIAEHFIAAASDFTPL